MPASGGIDIVAAGAVFFLAAFVCGMVFKIAQVRDGWEFPVAI